MKEIILFFNECFPNIILNSIIEKSGYDNQILEINNTWICKYPKKVSDKKFIELEINLLNYLKNKITTQIPNIQCYNFEKSIFIYKKLYGSELTTNIFNELSISNKTNLVKDLALFLFELHKIPLTDLQAIKLPNTDWPLKANELETRWKKIKSDTELDKFFESLIKGYKFVESNNKNLLSLIHGDLHQENIIFDEYTNKLSGIIDFTDAAIGDPDLDFRLLYQINNELSQLVVKEYEKIALRKININKILIYYFATEFSRFVEKSENNDINELKKIRERIIKNLTFAKFNNFI